VREDVQAHAKEEDGAYGSAGHGAFEHDRVDGYGSPYKQWVSFAGGCLLAYLLSRMRTQAVLARPARKEPGLFSALFLLLDRC